MQKAGFLKSKSHGSLMSKSLLFEACTSCLTNEILGLIPTGLEHRTREQDILGLKPTNLPRHLKLPIVLVNTKEAVAPSWHD